MTIGEQIKKAGFDSTCTDPEVCVETEIGKFSIRTIPATCIVWTGSFHPRNYEHLPQILLILEAIHLEAHDSDPVAVNVAISFDEATNTDQITLLVMGAR